MSLDALSHLATIIGTGIVSLAAVATCFKVAFTAGGLRADFRTLVAQIPAIQLALAAKSQEISEIREDVSQTRIDLAHIKGVLNIIPRQTP